MKHISVEYLRSLVLIYDTNSYREIYDKENAMRSVDANAK